MVTKLLLFALSLAWVGPSMSSRVLLMPGPIFSHVNFFSTAGRALKDNGHEVFVLTVKKLEHVVLKHGLVPLIHVDPHGKVDSYEKVEPFLAEVAKGQLSVPKMFMNFLPLMAEFCKEINRNEPLMKQLKDLKFDLSINDGVFFYTSLYVIPYRLGIKYITMTAMHDPWTYGVSGLPSVEPAQLTSYTNKMSFFQRMINIIPFVALATNPVSFLYSSEIVEEFAPHRPYKSIRNLVSGSELTLVNHEVTCIGYPRVSSPNYRFIGGSSAKPASPLPDDLAKFADGAKDGLIVLSFGSIKAMHTLWPMLKPKVMKALGRLPQRAVVQYALDDVKDAPKNVKLVKWLPQNDLLGHPNTRVFITHGGNNGQLEAVYHGVPILTIPFNGDQFSNANQARERGFGLVLDRLTFTEEQLYQTLKELVANPSYSEKIQQCSDIIKSMPPSQEMTVFWVNHILRYGGDHLKSPAIDMPMYQILMLDVFLFIFSIVLLCLFATYFCCRKCYRTCCSTQKRKTKKE